MKLLFLISFTYLIFSSTSLFAQPIIKVVDSNKILEHTKEKQYLDSIYCWGYDTLNVRLSYLTDKFYKAIEEWGVFYGCSSPKVWEKLNKQGLVYQNEILNIHQFAQNSFSIEILQLENEIQKKVIQPILNKYATTHQIGFIIDIENLHYFTETDNITNEIIAIIDKESLDPYIDGTWYFKVQALVRAVKKQLKFDIPSIRNWN